MKLENKKNLIARTLNIGKGRISFNRDRLDEIGEAITRQDIRELLKSKAIIINNPRGRRKLKKRLNRRRAGSIKKKVNRRKRDYVEMVRKLRGYLSELRRKKMIDEEQYTKFRKGVKSGGIRSKHALKEAIKAGK